MQVTLRLAGGEDTGLPPTWMAGYPYDEIKPVHLVSSLTTMIVVDATIEKFLHKQYGLTFGSGGSDGVTRQVVVRDLGEVDPVETPVLELELPKWLLKEGLDEASSGAGE